MLYNLVMNESDLPYRIPQTYSATLEYIQKANLLMAATGKNRSVLIREGIDLLMAHYGVEDVTQNHNVP